MSELETLHAMLQDLARSKPGKAGITMPRLLEVADFMARNAKAFEIGLRILGDPEFDGLALDEVPEWLAFRGNTICGWGDTPLEALRDMDNE